MYEIQAVIAVIRQSPGRFKILRKRFPRSSIRKTPQNIKDIEVNGGRAVLMLQNRVQTQTTTKSPVRLQGSRRFGGSRDMRLA